MLSVITEALLPLTVVEPMLIAGLRTPLSAMPIACSHEIPKDLRRDTSEGASTSVQIRR